MQLIIMLASLFVTKDIDMDRVPCTAYLVLALHMQVSINKADIDINKMRDFIKKPGNNQEGFYKFLSYMERRRSTTVKQRNVAVRMFLYTLLKIP